LFIEEEISRCASDVDQMVEEYKQYQQSSQEKKDHDELKRRVDVVNEHWRWLTRIKTKYQRQLEKISNQLEKFNESENWHKVVSR